MQDVLAVLLLLAIVGLFLLASYGERNKTARVATLVTVGGMAGIALLLATLVGLVAAARYALGALSVSEFRAAETLAIPLLVAGALGLLLLAHPVQRFTAHLLPINVESPVGYTALVLALLFLGYQLATQLSADVLTIVANGPPLTLGAILAQDMPLVLLAYVGVGTFTKRSPAEASRRLGLTLPKSAWWWLVALVAIVVFLLVGAGLEALSGAVSPDAQRRVTQASNAVFREFNNPSSIIFLAGVAGVAEELLFRGAMQPRFGLVFTALLFAAAHTQYGITFASLEVFVLGIGLGWLRLHSGTLTSILTHVGYDIAVGLIPIVFK